MNTPSLVYYGSYRILQSFSKSFLFCSYALTEICLVSSMPCADLLPSYCENKAARAIWDMNVLEFKDAH